MRPRTLTICGLTIMGWGLFIASFFMAAAAGQSGWDAFTGSIMALAYFPIIFVGDPGTALMLPTFLVINLVMFLSPLAQCSKWAGLLTAPLLVATAWPWLLPADVLSDRLIGFYCWDLSFIVMVAACALRSAGAYADYRQKQRRRRAIPGSAAVHISPTASWSPPVP